MTILKKGQFVAVPATKYKNSIFGKVVRVYYSKDYVMYDILWDNDIAKATHSERQIKFNIQFDKWAILDNEKELLKYKLKMGS
jgi:hypothetical protein